VNIRCDCLSALKQVAVFAVLFAASAGAQPDWVKQAIEGGVDVVPHKDAAVLVLHAGSDVVVSPAGRVERDNRWAARVLARAGVDAVSFHEGITTTRKVKNLKGWLIKPDGRKFNLEKDRVVEVDLEQVAGFYDDARSLVYSFSDVKPGDVVAYEYTVEEDDPWTAYSQAFIFQVSEPVRSARFAVTVPAGWQTHISTQQSEPVQHSVIDNRHVWSVANLEYRPDEPLMPPWWRLSRSVVVSCYDPRSDGQAGYPDWRSVAGWMRGLQDRACAETTALAGDVRSICGDLADPGARLRAIAHFVRDNIRYVAVEIGVGRFQPRVAATTLANRYGDCKDKVALMRAMLGLAGIRSEAAGALIDGEVDPQSPTPLQFNHVIVAVPLAAVPDLPSYPEATVDGWLYFDPTDEATDLGQLPAGLRGTYVLKTSSEDSVATHLPPLEPENQRRVYYAEAAMQSDLSMQAKVRVVDFGVWGTASRHEHRTSPVKDLVQGWQEHFASVMQNPTLSEFTTGSDGDSAWVCFSLAGERVASEAGPYYLLSTDFFHGDQADDLTAAERVHPVSFGSPGQVLTLVNWRLPSGWTTDGKPTEIRDSCALARVDCRVNGDSLLTLESNIVYYGGTVGPDAYDQAKRFNKSLRASQRVRTFLMKKGR
jgi:transglutaminase-like putative cysteine protease